MITTTFNNDSTNIDNIKVKGETDYTLYSCRAVVAKELKGTPIIDKTIPPDVTNGFDVYFTPEEAESLTPGFYHIFYEVTKTKDAIITYRREYHKKIRVDPDGI